MPSEVGPLVDAVERSRAALLRTVDRLREDQGAFRPGDGEWSITENVEHLYLAEMSGLTKMWGAASAFRDGIRWQRVDFLRFHIDRHLGQIRRVTAHPEFPA